MPRYVCDTEQVILAGENLCKYSTELQSSLSTYSSDMVSTLSTWNGTAKSNFINQCGKQMDIALKQAETINKIGEFMKSSARSIDQLEDDLASLSI